MVSTAKHKGNHLAQESFLKRKVKKSEQPTLAISQGSGQMTSVSFTTYLSKLAWLIYLEMVEEKKRYGVIHISHMV
jgi:hypothetical protein